MAAVARKNVILVNSEPNEYLAASGGRKRTAAQQEADMVIIADMYVRGFTFAEIAQTIEKERGYRMGIEEVSYDLDLIRREWMQRALANFDEVKSNELAKIDRLEREAWDSLQQSKQDQTSTLTEFYSEKTAEGDRVGKKSVTKKTQGSASVEYMKVIQWCIDKRCKIFGLDAPQRLEVDWRAMAKRSGVQNPEAMLNKLVSQYVKGHTQVDAGDAEIIEAIEADDV